MKNWQIDIVDEIIYFYRQGCSQYLHNIVIWGRIFDPSVRSWKGKDLYGIKTPQVSPAYESLTQPSTDKHVDGFLEYGGLCLFRISAEGHNCKLTLLLFNSRNWRASYVPMTGQCLTTLQCQDTSEASKFKFWGY